MYFSQIKIAQFRNFEQVIIPVGQKQVLLIGENGQGKTNLLEAIYTLCYGSSFRTSNIKELINQKYKDFKITGIYQDNEGLDHELEFLFKDNKRTIRLDQRMIIDRKELIYNIPCIVFSHDDIWFVTGEPEQRRHFFDQTMSMYDSLFFDDLRKYKNVLKQRNQAIKDKRDELLGIYDMQLASHGLNIQNARIKAVYEFNQIFPALYKEVSESPYDLTISYIPSWNSCTTESEILELLKNTRERDFILQTTSSGIQRDRFIVTYDDKPFMQIGSTGQVRLASLLFRVAQMNFYTRKTKRNPLILVDDVLLELDFEKRARFLEVLKGYDQAFFTFLPEEKYFYSLSEQDAIIYDVKQGSFKNREKVKL